MLDSLLTQKGDDPTITAALDSQILARFAPSFAAGAGGPSVPTSYLIVWFDPVSLDLQSAQGQGVSYSLATNVLSSNLAQTFVSVGGTSRCGDGQCGGYLQSGCGQRARIPRRCRGAQRGGSQEFSFTDALREGMTSFQLNLSDAAGPAGGPATGPADAVGATSPGTALAAAFTQPAALALTIGLIGTPSAEFDATAAQGRAASRDPAERRGQHAGQSLSQNSGANGSTASDDGEVLRRKQYLSSSKSYWRDRRGHTRRRREVGQTASRGEVHASAPRAHHGPGRGPGLAPTADHAPAVAKLIDVVDRPGVPAEVGAVTLGVFPGWAEGPQVPCPRGGTRHSNDSRWRKKQRISTSTPHRHGNPRSTGRPCSCRSLLIRPGFGPRPG